MTCGIKDFNEENKERIEKNKRELVILNARMGNLWEYVELLEHKVDSLQKDLRKAFVLIWLLLILLIASIA